MRGAPFETDPLVSAVTIGVITVFIILGITILSGPLPRLVDDLTFGAPPTPSQAMCDNIALTKDSYRFWARAHPDTPELHYALTRPDLYIETCDCSETWICNNETPHLNREMCTLVECKFKGYAS